MSVTGIEDPDTFGSVILYPNPSKGLINLDVENNLIGKLNVRIFNQSGKKIFERDFDKNGEKLVQHIDISRESVGLYVISLYINGQFSSLKFIIEK